MLVASLALTSGRQVATVTAQSDMNNMYYLTKWYVSSICYSTKLYEVAFFTVLSDT